VDGRVVEVYRDEHGEYVNWVEPSVSGGRRIYLEDLQVEA